MKSRPSTTNVQNNLLKWFTTNRRDLPWRRTHDPYLIAVSEVMLQQTQVQRVIPKYLAWRRAWPGTSSLAGASLSDVLRLWSGLGYNSRAVRLRQAARLVMKKFGGRWPRTIEQLASLPGFGPYTARAVASFSFNADVTAIDTNIRRVVSRIFFGTRAVSKKVLEQQAQDILPPNKSATWHAALMDFGSAICTSSNPKCASCPMKSFCRAYPAILLESKKKKTSSAKFQDSDRYWRGAIIRQFLKHGEWTERRLYRSLQQSGPVDNKRVVRLLQALTTDGLLKRRGNTFRLAS